MRSIFGFLAVTLVAALFLTSCWGGGGRTLWETPGTSALLPLVEFANTGDIGLTLDDAGVGGYFTSANSIGVQDPASGASVVMLPDTYVTVNGMAPTWVDLGVGPMDKEPLNTALADMKKVGGCKVSVETSLGSVGAMFSRNLTVTLPVAAGYADGTSAYVYWWSGSAWQNFYSVSQSGGFNVYGGFVTIQTNQGGNFAVFVDWHDAGSGSGG
ncbi:hypothetical protein J7K50_01000 [bacterium]|nr:hypothetical protein [bacterium]